MKTTIKHAMLAITLLTGMNAFAAPVYFNTDEGMNRFIVADHRSDFPRLANFYEAQQNKVFCGVATVTIVLNALKIKELDQATTIPYDTSLVGADEKGYFPAKHNWQPYFHRYTQRTVLTHSPKSRLEIMGKPVAPGQDKDYGLQLAQFTNMVKSNGVHIRTIELATLNDPAGVKADMIQALDKKDTYLVANYNRKSVDQKGGGHFSPVAAYDSKSDSFLVLDVNSAKYPWAWIDADTFIEAMHTKDVNAYRGYAVITR